MKKIGKYRIRASIKVVGVTTPAQKHMNRLIAKEDTTNDERGTEKKFEELLNALAEHGDRKVLGVDFDPYRNFLGVHVVNGHFPDEFLNKNRFQYVWIGGHSYQWQKQILINGVMYYDVITQEQFEQETGEEK